MSLSMTHDSLFTCCTRILRGMGLDFGMQFDEQGNPIPGTGGGEIDTEAGDEDEFETAVQ